MPNMTKYGSPTTYNGIKYRSKLEARWAAFFTTLGIEFDYEPEGFKFSGQYKPNGYGSPSLSYRPDFFLPKLNVWAEVKPTAPTMEETAKVTRLSAETEQSVYFLFGPPKNDMGQVWRFDPSFDSDEFVFAYCDTCNIAAPAWCGELICQCDSFSGGANSMKIKKAVEASMRIQDDWKRPEGK